MGLRTKWAYLSLGTSLRKSSNPDFFEWTYWTSAPLALPEINFHLSQVCKWKQNHLHKHSSLKKQSHLIISYYIRMMSVAY